jgi:APA family basic amino acid/polyamine antiporter
VVGIGSFAVSPSFISNYTPLAPNGFGNIGTSIVLFFWAYVGFEMGTLPADEVKDPSKTILRAIIVGMAVVSLFYISTNFIIFGVVKSAELSRTAVPLVLVGAKMIRRISGQSSPSVV